MATDKTMVDFIPYLEASDKGDNKYICPVCGGGNLSVNLDSGAFQCWSGECDTGEIFREAGELAGVKIGKGSPKTKTKLAMFPDNVDVQPSVSEKTEGGLKTTYQYSATQFVYRTDKSDGTKSITVAHRKTLNSKLVYAKGNNPYPLFREAEILEYGSNKWVLVVEGEKSVDIARENGFVTTTLQGSSWTKKDVFNSFYNLRGKVSGVIILPDNDDVGRKKAKDVDTVCKFIGIQSSIVDIKTNFKYLRKGDDVVEILEKVGKQKLVDVLEETIKSVKDADAEPSQIRAICNDLSEIYGERLYYDEFYKRIALDGESASVDDLYLELGDEYNKDYPKQVCIDSIKRYAHKTTRNPVQEQFVEWDATITPINIYDIPKRYLGIDDPVLNSIFAKQLIACVTRIFNPGVKHDITTILVGTKQGERKTTFWSTFGGISHNGDLFDYPFHIVSTLDDRDDREVKKLHTAGIVNMDEFDGISGKKGIERLKRFTTQTSDMIRNLYESDAKEYKRQFIFVGSSNTLQCLKDPTGNRRFALFPLKVRKINTERLATEVKGMWVSAYREYLKGTTFHLTEMEELYNNQLNENYRSADPKEELIENYVSGKEFVSTNEIITNALGLDPSKKEASSITRQIGVVMDKLGYEYGRTRINGKQVRGYKWIATDVSDSLPAPPEPTDTGQTLTNSNAKPVITTNVVLDTKNPAQGGRIVKDFVNDTDAYDGFDENARKLLGIHDYAK